MRRLVWLFVTLGLVCACSLAASLVAPVAAKATVPASTWPDQQVWVTNGSIDAIATAPDGTTYVGGSFSYIGPKTGDYMAALDATSGSLETSFPAVNGQVYAEVSDDAGGFYIGGDFTQVGGLARNDIAHILADGSVDPAFDPSANGAVDALAVSGSLLYAGGNFTMMDGESRDGLAALDATIGAATAWDPGLGPVSALAVSAGGIVYVGVKGTYNDTGGYYGGYLVALGPTEEPDVGYFEWEDGLSGGRVSALALSGSTLYVGGMFNSLDIKGEVQSCTYLAALDAADGTVSTTTTGIRGWDYHTNGWVNALAVSGSTLYVGGEMGLFGGGWDDATNGPVDALAVSGSTVYVGGGFTTIGGQPRNYIAGLDATSGDATTWDPEANGPVDALAVSGSTVCACGGFDSVGGHPCDNIAALDATSGAATTWDPEANGSVDALAVSGSTVYAGGNFTTIGGQTRSNIAALDATSGDATTWDPDANGPVDALAVSGSNVYAGGNFTTIGGQTRYYIAALDATSGDATAWDADSDLSRANGPVDALAVSGSNVYAGGNFTTIGGRTRSNIAALDATSGDATAWDPEANGTVDALAVSGSTVYAGGKFTTTGGQTRSSIAALDATSGAATTWDPDANGNLGSVDALAVSGSTVYAGGNFTTIGGQTRSNIAALDATSGDATTWDPEASGPVDALAVSGATVYAGGYFSTVAGQMCPCLARFSPPTEDAPQISGLAPAVGATASQVTITGSGFGATQGGGDITFGVESAAVTSWSATQVICTVPADLAGGVPVVVTTSDALASVPTNFSVTPAIGSMRPARGRVGATVTITGSGFGATQGSSSVTFGGARAAIASWSATQVVCRVPVGLCGVVPMVLATSGATASRPTNFSVTPTILSLRPAHGTAGAMVTIIGSGFGAHRGKARVFFGGKAVTRYVSWHATWIRVRVPRLAKCRRAVTVTTVGGTSNARTFTVI